MEPGQTTHEDVVRKVEELEGVSHVEKYAAGMRNEKTEIEVTAGDFDTIQEVADILEESTESYSETAHTVRVVIERT